MLLFIKHDIKKASHITGKQQTENILILYYR